MDPADLSSPGTEGEEEDDQKIKFAFRGRNVEEPLPTPARTQATTDCKIINMVKTLNGAIAAVSQGTARIQRAYDQLWAENIARDRALTDLSEIVKEYGSSPGNGQRALQLVSYLDEAAMNVAQELGDSELYNYDVLFKLLSDRFDPASRVSAFRSRFHGLSRRHHEDADAFADALAELCRVGYPQSPPELRP